MSHEETVVRTAYAKLAYASQLGTISELAQEAGGNGFPVSTQHIGMTTAQRFAESQINFTLDDFVVGNASDILNQRVITFVTPPTPEVLVAYRGSMSRSEAGLDTRWDSISLKWQPGPGPVPPEGQKLMLGEVLADDQLAQNRPLWQRYASYMVTVNFQGKSQGPYKAMFMFGRGSKGNEVVRPIDTITGATGLAEALHGQLFPDAFLLTRLRTW